MASILSSMDMLSRVAKMAIPNAPETLRTRARTAEALPISSLGTTAAMTPVRWDMPKPIPNIMTTSGIMTSSELERTSRPTNRNNAIPVTRVLMAIT